MALSATVRKLWLIDNPRLRRLVLKRKRCAVHELNQDRAIYGEFHHLYKGLRRNPERFFEFLRMSVETFDYILGRVKHRLKKKVTNFKKPISPAERLYVTLR